MTTLSDLDIYQRSTKTFDVTITQDGSNPDISSDTVTLLLKKNRRTADASADMDVDADVATEGASGVAKFTLDTSDTDLPQGDYYYEIKWTTSGGAEYVLEEGILEIQERVSD